MPHARHGGNGVCAFAVVGSKLVGSGFENEHIGHIQVTLCGHWLLAVELCPARGLPPRGRGEAVALREGL